MLQKDKSTNNLQSAYFYFIMITTIWWLSIANKQLAHLYTLLYSSSVYSKVFLLSLSEDCLLNRQIENAKVEQVSSFVFREFVKHLCTLYLRGNSIQIHITYVVLVSSQKAAFMFMNVFFFSGLWNLLSYMLGVLIKSMFLFLYNCFRKLELLSCKTTKKPWRPL